MKSARPPEEPTFQPDLELAGGCLACGGVLSVRVRPGSSRAVCRSCGWWSSPLLVQEEDGLRLRHPAAGEA
jgi:hypothetical protein